MRSDGGTGTGQRASAGAGASKPQGGERAPSKPAPKPAVKSFVPSKGAVAPNGIRFK